MMRRYRLFAIAIFLCNCTFSQQLSTSNSKKLVWKYTGQASVGGIVGANAPSYSFQTLQGIEKKGWMLALGIGWDDYVAPGISLVAHAQKALSLKKHHPLVYLQAGPAFPSRVNDWKDTTWLGYQQFHLQTGWLAEAGLGYQWKLGKQLKVGLNIGYSYKQAHYREREELFWSWPIIPRPAESPAKYTYNQLDMQRLILKCMVGW